MWKYKDKKSPFLNPTINESINFRIVIRNLFVIIIFFELLSNSLRIEGTELIHGSNTTNRIIQEMQIIGNKFPFQVLLFIIFFIDFFPDKILCSPNFQEPLKFMEFPLSVLGGLRGVGEGGGLRMEGLFVEELGGGGGAGYWMGG